MRYNGSSEMRLLVVEDEPRLADIWRDAFGEAGYAVDVAGDGEQADFLAQTERYDAVVLDLGLPKVDGLTLLAPLARGGHQGAGAGAHRARQLAREGPGHRRRRRRLRAKPFQMEEVLARVRGADPPSRPASSTPSCVRAVALDTRLARSRSTARRSS